MKKVKLIICFFVFFLIININLNKPVLATGFDLPTIFSNGNDWINNASQIGNVDDANKIAGDIAGILTYFGVALAAGVGIIMGIRYMIAASTEEKANVKKSMAPWIIGTVVILGAAGIWKLALTVLDSINL